MDNSEVIVIIGCDADPDRNPKGRSIDDNEDIWDGVIKGIPELKETLSSFVRATEDPYPNITWLLRSDEQMNMLYNDYAFPVHYFMDMWKSFKRDGDEIGWHPHTWDWNEVNKWWYPRLEDNEWINKCFDKGYNAIKRYFKITSVRTGWDFQSNVIMKKLADLGISVDLSALPGQKNIVEQSTYYYDWKITTEKFYFPSKNDYRREAKSGSGEESLNILEMPVSLTPISLTRSITKFLYHNAKQFFYNSLDKPMISYGFHRGEPMRTTKHPKLFEPGVERKFKESGIRNCTTYLISYFHANELFQNDLFSISNFEKNLKYISNMSKKYDTPFRFLTATEAAEDYIKYHSRKY